MPMERRLPNGINPLQLVALYVLLQAVRDAIVAEGESDIHDREELLKWLGEPWADVLISVAGLEWLETPIERLNFLEAGLERLGPPWCNGCTASL